MYHNLICRWTNSSWPIATCWSPTWTDWSVKRSRRLKKPLSRKCASDQEAPSLVPLLSSVASVDVKLSFSASFNCLLLRTALTFYQFWAVINPCLCAGCLNYPVSGQWSDMQGPPRPVSMTTSCFCVVLFFVPTHQSIRTLTDQPRICLGWMCQAHLSARMLLETNLVNLNDSVQMSR